MADARVNINYNSLNGDLQEMVNFDSTDDQVREWVSEAIRTGSVPGMTPAANDEAVDLSGYKVERFPATDARPFDLIQVRPKTAYGA